MASKNQSASALSKNSKMLTNDKMHNVCPMKKTLYSASPGEKKTGGTNSKAPCARRWEQGSEHGSEVGGSNRLSTGTHRRPMAAPCLFYVLPMTARRCPTSRHARCSARE
jgi:hypothetical protein